MSRHICKDGTHEEQHYFVNWKKVCREEFMKAAGVAGATDFHGIAWETFHDRNGTIRSCVVGDSMFMTFSTRKPCLN